MIRGRKLVLRIYLIGLAQIAALAVTFALAREAREPPVTPREQETRFLVDEIAAAAPDRAALEARLRDLKERAGMTVELRDRSGAVVASSGPVTGPRAFTIDWSGGAASIKMPPYPAPAGGPVFAIAAVLVLVGISAVFMAMWLGRPLASLSAAARRFGAGDLSARADLSRSDELGDVAEAFNEMAARIEDLVRGQRELLANVSHELRTPLARIRVALDLAAEGSAQDAAASLSGIAGDLGEIERLINDILTSARLEISSAAPPLRVERTPAKDLIEASVERFRAARPERSLRIEDATAGAQLDVDRMLLRRALDNLLDNAAKYSDGAIALNARAEGGSLTLEVRDAGAGISPADQKRLFSPFFRADRSRARKTGGLGLGLLLARRIVEAHHGTLEIASAPGEGTIAKIRVPTAG
ncbi:MAG: HAMP domain-containing protein [Myxococcales bacterium]|nr:HAMP domain-containing protein [Myxococcales bacterium]